MAALAGATADDVVFTSGGTEANALAIDGLLRGIGLLRNQPRPPHVVTSPLEHPSVLAALTARGAEVSFVAVGAKGEITPEALAAALRPDTALVSLALANHELGNVYDIAALARVARAAGAAFHTDAVAAAGKLALDLNALGVDALTVSAHKIHGPKGVGAVFLRRGSRFEPPPGGATKNANGAREPRTSPGSSGSAPLPAWPAQIWSARRRG